MGTRSSPTLPNGFPVGRLLTENGLLVFERKVTRRHLLRFLEAWTIGDSAMAFPLLAYLFSTKLNIQINLINLTIVISRSNIGFNGRPVKWTTLFRVLLLLLKIALLLIGLGGDSH